MVERVAEHGEDGDGGFGAQLDAAADGGGGSRGRFKQAKWKMESELRATLEWEKDWGIKSNLSKSKIQCTGAAISTLEKIGGIESDGIKIPLSHRVTVLGGILGKKRRTIMNIRSSLGNARGALAKLYRFKNAPERIKKHLIKALVRPILEYPVALNRNLSTRAQKQMQGVQNKALRFVKGLRKGDRVRMSDLHDELGFEPINVRIDQLANKMINKMKDLYYIPKDQPRLVNYKYSDFTITTPPLRSHRKTLVQKINKHILKVRKHKLLFKSEPSIANWSPPTPIFVSQ